MKKKSFYDDAHEAKYNLGLDENREIFDLMTKMFDIVHKNIENFDIETDEK